MIRLPLVMSLLTLIAAPGFADDTVDFMDALGKAATGMIVAEAYQSACDARYPDSQQARRDAMAGWSHRVDAAGYHRFLEAAFAVMPDLASDLEENRARAHALVEDDVTTDGAPCTEFRNTLNDTAMFDIETPIRYLLRNAGDFGIIVADARSPGTDGEITVTPLIVLSAQLAAKMDEVGSKAGAEADRDLRDAREAHAQAWLAQRPALAIYGRVTGKDSLREWRGDQQSTFFSTCRSFADDDQEAAMTLGAQRIVVGAVRWIADRREGGEISLDDCRVFAHDPDQISLVTLADDSAGLMLRPLDFVEAYAGPGQGISVETIERVLYDAEFSNRIDGFGNGYTQRDEDIFVLLRDGTAYRHEWNFAFTDLNLELSRQRERDRWFTWRETGGTVIVTQTGGLDAGSEIDLSEARRLMPLPPGHTLDATFYYLNVGMGGSRSDRDYVFTADGELRHTRSGFVAGNFGTSYIIVAGEGGNQDSLSSYAFDGYTLLVDGPEGQERHFVALIDGQDVDRPQEIIIDGQVHWLRKGTE
jgi:hypothetical protein